MECTVTCVVFVRRCSTLVSVKSAGTVISAQSSECKRSTKRKPRPRLKNPITPLSFSVLTAESEHIWLIPIFLRWFLLLLLFFFEFYMYFFFVAFCSFDSALYLPSLWRTFVLCRSILKSIIGRLRICPSSPANFSIGFLFHRPDRAKLKNALLEQKPYFL